MHQRLVHRGELVLRVALGDGARPRAGVRRLAVIPLAVLEVELAQLDELRVGLELLGPRQGVLEQRVGGGEARVALVHRRRREQEHAGWGAGRLGVLVEEVRRLVLDELARHDGRKLHVHPIRAFLEGKHRHLLFVVAGRPLAGQHAVFPPVPGTHHELAAHPALRERAALVIADVGDRREAPLVEEDGDAVALDLDRERDPGEQLVHGAEAVPGRCRHGRDSGRERGVNYSPWKSPQPVLAPASASSP